jgi:lysophospholipase L1-like esterase
MRVLLVAVVVAAVAAPVALADAAKVGYPSSMASTGDSITRAFNTGFFPFLDAPQNSWSTGTSSTVNSHYRRILAANPAISGKNFNDAKSGAKMVDLDGQVLTAASQGVDYVTILMGANDVCTSSESSMTPVATYGAQFSQAMRDLSTRLPDARISVLSPPDVYHLWDLFHTNKTAVRTWSTYGICQSLLANATSFAQADVDRRARVRQRELDDITQLQQICAMYIHCRFDNSGVFNTQFATTDVSTRDYFHPSLSGQATLAAGTWAGGFDFTDQIAPMTTATTSVDSTGATTVTLDATDNVAVSGIEYRVDGGGWQRYAASVTLAPGTTLTFRAVDVNGNVEATQTVAG